MFPFSGAKVVRLLVLRTCWIYSRQQVLRPNFEGKREGRTNFINVGESTAGPSGRAV